MSKDADPVGNDPVDPLPGLLADMDQAVMMVPQLARYAYALYTGFLGEGFTEDQALALTMNQIKF